MRELKPTLCTLPAEIRLRIWKHLFINVVKVAGKARSGSSQSRTTAQVGALGNPLAISTVCKLFHREALPEMYRTSTFQFEWFPPVLNQDLIEKFRFFAPASALRAMKLIKFDVHRRHHKPGFYIKERTLLVWSEPLRWFRSQLPGLKEIRISCSRLFPSQKHDTSEVDAHYERSCSPALLGCAFLEGVRVVVEPEYVDAVTIAEFDGDCQVLFVVFGGELLVNQAKVSEREDHPLDYLLDRCKNLMQTVVPFTSSPTDLKLGCLPVDIHFFAYSSHIGCLQFRTGFSVDGYGDSLAALLCQEGLRKRLDLKGVRRESI
ncbi:MAG: hypothetical protein LQ345_002511 [Seirophora villosa]|nr:MAG: hypothetical protein LQ345_002511 [Seirophora villosa]